MPPYGAVFYAIELVANYIKFVTIHNVHLGVRHIYHRYPLLMEGPIGVIALMIHPFLGH
jgi:hypothetical protein